jgi:CDGSH-type Zn-finger protein
MNRILVSENGPLECSGDFELTNADGTLFAHETQTWLCRCGRSADKPYCDGSHETTGFIDAGPAQSGAVAEQEPAGTVRVTLRKNGPLKLEGPCEVSDAGAGVLFRGSETALCRCGHSKKKPFCDGTHREIGFLT